MPVLVKVPPLAEEMESALVGRVLVVVGQRIVEHQPVAELETDKANVDIPSPSAGVVAAVHVRADDKVNVGDPIITLQPEAEPAAVRAALALPSLPLAPQPTPSSDTWRIAAPPAIRRLARERGIDLREVRGTGPAGLITTPDLLAHGDRSASSDAGRPPRRARPLPDFAAWGEIERQPLEGLRRGTARATAVSWGEIPQVTQQDQADITAIEEMRLAVAGAAAGKGGKLTITAILLRLVAAALKAFPDFNVSVDIDRQELIFKRYVHIGVAVDAPRGLMVPVIRDVDRKGILDLSVELRALAERARHGDLQLEEMRGGCFTISNLGALGTTFFSPIVSWPEVAILGVGRAQLQPVYVGRENEPQPRLILPLSLSYDHRAVDGARAARFLRWMAERLENPLLLALG